MGGKRFYLGVISVLVILSVVSIAFIGGCTRQSSTGEPSLPVPPTTPVTPGYIQVYDHKLGYGFEYPDDWEVHSPEEFPLRQGIEKVEMFTKKGEGTSITVIVKTTEWESLEEVKRQYGEINSQKTILKENITEVNGRKGYEIVHTDSPMKTREVVFLVNGKAYTVMYSTTEDLYAASEEIFDHVMNSFVIE